MRRVRTTSGATAVQVVWSLRRGSREIEHLEYAHDETELARHRQQSAHHLAVAGGWAPGPAGEKLFRFTRVFGDAERNRLDILIVDEPAGIRKDTVRETREALRRPGG